MTKIELYKEVVLKEDFIDEQKRIYKKGTHGYTVEYVDNPKYIMIEVSYKDNEDYLPVVPIDILDYAD